MLSKNIFICGVLALDLYSVPLTSSPELAIEYYSTQQQEKAFKIFLDSLQAKSVPDEYQATDEEQRLYRESLAIYLEAKGANWQSASQQILSRYAPILEMHPEYSELAYIVAVAYANQNNFVKHFEVFYRAYQRHPHHYLAYKTKAILWIKLFERELPGEAKEAARTQVLKHLEIAGELYPQDTSLYRLKILYASQSEKPKIVLESLNKIIREDIVIPRAELEFYLQQALSLSDRAATLRFIDKASHWYHFSRVIAAAREQMDMELNTNND